MLLLLCLVTTFTFAQESSETVEMADKLRASGKIYVVITVMSIIFVGLAIYLISIDKKVSRLEKEHNKNT